MSRTSNDFYMDGRLIQGFDYENQAWAASGVYLDCGHKKDLLCGCYGRAHKGEATKPSQEQQECGLCDGKGYVPFGSGSTACECQYPEGRGA
jgi:hypothetical protein